ncbi:hypothetical protein KKI24_23545 [bacterium]|nr:hypothetical protein [bacterium]
MITWSFNKRQQNAIRYPQYGTSVMWLSVGIFLSVFLQIKNFLEKKRVALAVRDNHLPDPKSKRRSG